MNDDIKEIIGDVADEAVRAHAEVEGFVVYTTDKDGMTSYTEEAQIIFDGYYDNYEDIARKWMESYPNTTPAYMKEILMNQAGLSTTPESIEWSNCAIAFYWEGTEEILEDDIVFDPGFYLWNDHTVLNWRTMTSEFDVVYLMQATGDRLADSGLPKNQDLYRMCDKGVVVRRLRREHESGGPRPAFENRSDGYVFIIDVPGKVRISGEEFHFMPLKHPWMYLYDRENSVAYPIIPKVEYDAGAYDTNWLNRVLEDHNELAFVDNVGGATIKSIYNRWEK